MRKYETMNIHEHNSCTRDNLTYSTIFNILNKDIKIPLIDKIFVPVEVGTEIVSRNKKSKSREHDNYMEACN